MDAILVFLFMQQEKSKSWQAKPPLVKFWKLNKSFAQAVQWDPEVAWGFTFTTVVINSDTKKLITMAIKWIKVKYTYKFSCYKSIRNKICIVAEYLAETCILKRKLTLWSFISYRGVTADINSFNWPFWISLILVRLSLFMSYAERDKQIIKIQINSKNLLFSLSDLAFAFGYTRFPIPSNLAGRKYPRDS